ncbi:DNA internalization-related competence protein ComEC/Rec2 [Parasulfuritortus cantonensis]|uniref:DNA internalization-related competence protein ComEC/Rec2 n=1 Tax=Parasulfuritortus cantonensis TaxID=2528202 RepID=A0A4R1B6W0_9PROT|nr:DNA internalization-related competence protein ComEC/Rec2 [Parasulfuritortus cantonensis]TCJ11785.1 DNA internalization-related competence protein ComEC/Rec2 [Parasulfuritortus cantonensis]
MPLRLLILSFVAGAAWLQTRPELPDPRWLWLLPGGWALAGLLPDAWPRRLLVGLLAGALGFGYAGWRAERRLADELPAAWQGRDVALVGRVAGLPEATPRGWRLVLDVERVDSPGARVPARIQLSRYAFAGAPEPAPRGGACLALSVRLNRPHGNVNPGGFDYEAWLFERGIRAVGYALAPARASAACPASAAALVDGWRQALRDRLAGELAGRPYAGVVVALAVGDQEAIPDAQWTLFRRTGVTHLMSISGLHVTLLAGLVYALVNLAWRRLPGLAVRLAAGRAASLAGLATAALYVALAGFGLPAQRTLYMLAAAAVALWLGRTDSPSRVLAAAAGVVVAIDPWAALAPGFWLSFGAVAALMYAAAGRLRRRSFWTAWPAAQWAVSLALAPALLVLFHEVSLVAPLANAVAIPLIGLLAVPVILAAALLPVPFLATLGHGLVAAAMAALDWLAGLPQPVWHGATPTWPALLLALLGVAVLLAPRGLPGRWLGLLLCLPLLAPRLDHPVPGSYWVDVIDVGQGLAVLVRTAGHVLLYDAGPRYASGEDAGARVVAPFLFGQGIGRLDGMVVSHDDADHSGGMAALLASHAPAWRLSSAPLPGARRCAAGQVWQWDGVRFEVLHPPARYYAQPGFPDNDLSCVVRVAGRDGSTLLTGDIGRLGELSLLELAGDRLRSDVLVVAHHGSGGSSMAPFVEAVAPRLAVFSVGLRNRFGHPDAAVLARFRAAGAAIARTDRDGALHLAVAGRGLPVRAARVADRRYWQADGT